MALKRKRSSPTVDSPATVSSETSSMTIDSSGAIPFYYQQNKAVPAYQEKPTWSWPTYDDGDDHATSLSTQLNSRTTKRHRDNRPDEEQVAAFTISRLFDAQRRQPHAEPVLSNQVVPVGSATGSEKAQKSTLHAFWKLPSAPAAVNTDVMDIDGVQSRTTAGNGLRCEDCDRGLQRHYAMGLDEGVVEQETACAVCRRRVCDTCAVMGDQRICLGCANGR